MLREFTLSTTTSCCELQRHRCPFCGEREDPFAPDCCECLQCERCGVRSPLRVENAEIVTPAGWRLDDVHLCWQCIEHTTVGAFLEQHE